MNRLKSKALACAMAIALLLVAWGLGTTVGWFSNGQAFAQEDPSHWDDNSDGEDNDDDRPRLNRDDDRDDADNDDEGRMEAEFDDDARDDDARPSERNGDGSDDDDHEWRIPASRAGLRTKVQRRQTSESPIHELEHDLEQSEWSTRTQDLAARIQHSTGPEREQLVQQLKAVIASQFQQRQLRRQQDLDSLRQRLDALTFDHQQRSKHATRIVEQRLRDLVDTPSTPHNSPTRAPRPRDNPSSVTPLDVFDPNSMGTLSNDIAGIVTQVETTGRNFSISEMQPGALKVGQEVILRTRLSRPSLPAPELFPTAEPQLASYGLAIIRERRQPDEVRAELIRSTRGIDSAQRRFEWMLPTTEDLVTLSSVQPATANDQPAPMLVRYEPTGVEYSSQQLTGFVARVQPGGTVGVVKEQYGGTFQVGQPLVLFHAANAVGLQPHARAEVIQRLAPDEIEIRLIASQRFQTEKRFEWWTLREGNPIASEAPAEIIRQSTSR